MNYYQIFEWLRKILEVKESLSIDSLAYIIQTTQPSMFYFNLDLVVLLNKKRTTTTPRKIIY